ncbi:hypothetical protein ACLESD_37890 [Pyxidicoccus sp. 3LFB2]
MSRPTPSWTKALGGLALTSLLGLGCEPPPIVPTADRRQNTHTARIEGNLVVNSRARGNAVVFLYDAERPPPPQGTGRPIAFTLIPAAQLFGASGDTLPGPFTAPFTFSLVPVGRYMLRGFIDSDTCATQPQPCHTPDFNPWYGVTSEPNAGDVGGAAVDPTTGAPIVLEITEDADKRPQPLTGVSVSFSDTARVPVDRPAFTVTPPDRMMGSTTKVLRLQRAALHGGAVDQRPPGFLVSYVDADRDGKPDDANKDGVPDLWPRVVVRKLADSGLLEDNDLDRDGVLDADAPADKYPRADGLQDGKPELVVLAAGLVPDGPIAALTDEQGNPRMTPVIVPELTVVVRPLALDGSNPAAPVQLREMPKGRYTLVLIQSTGQTWRVPNEMDPVLASAVGLPGDDSQAFVLEVP